MSYGSATLALDQFKKIYPEGKNLECAIIGSGAMGLLTAVQLVKLGHKPTIYSARVPKCGEKDNNECITSQIAPGLWLPYGYDNQDPIKHEQVSKRSFDYFSECIENKRYPTGLHYCKVYDRGLAAGVLEEAMPKNITDNKSKKMNIRF